MQGERGHCGRVQIEGTLYEGEGYIEVEGRMKGTLRVGAG